MARYYINIGDDQSHFCLIKIEENNGQIVFRWPSAEELGILPTNIHDTYHTEDLRNGFNNAISQLREIQGKGAVTLIDQEIEPIKDNYILGHTYMDLSKFDWHKSQKFRKSSYTGTYYLPRSLQPHITIHFIIDKKGDVHEELLSRLAKNEQIEEQFPIFLPLANGVATIPKDHPTQYHPIRLKLSDSCLILLIFSTALPKDPSWINQIGQEHSGSIAAFAPGHRYINNRSSA